MVKSGLFLNIMTWMDPMDIIKGCASIKTIK